MGLQKSRMNDDLRHHDTDHELLAYFQNPSFHDFPDRSLAIPYDHTLFSRSSFHPSLRPFDHLICFSHTCSSLYFDFRALRATPALYVGFTPPLHSRSSIIFCCIYLFLDTYRIWLVRLPDRTSGIRSCLTITLMLRYYFVLLPKRPAWGTIRPAPTIHRAPVIFLSPTFSLRNRRFVVLRLIGRTLFRDDPDYRN